MIGMTGCIEEILPVFQRVGAQKRPLAKSASGLFISGLNQLLI
jgi:hypothetical protein